MNLWDILYFTLSQWLRVAMFFSVDFDTFPIIRPSDLNDF